jgi:hypothetical protein
MRSLPALELERVIIAADLNPRYMDCWPLAKRAWLEIAELEPILVLVSTPAAVPECMRDDTRVHVFEPVEGVHTTFQAQAIRLLFPALLDGGGVVTADADMFPLNRRYLRRGASAASAAQFVAYRNVLLAIGQIPICYNAARPETWAELFAVDDLDDVRLRLEEWAAGHPYSGERGGEGWSLDQTILFRSLVDWGRRTGRAWILDDDFTRFRRLDRLSIGSRSSLRAYQTLAVGRGWYSDYHAPPPATHGDLNALVDETAVRGLAGNSWTMRHVRRARN